MKEIILIRHGEAEHLLRGLTGGWTDLPLTDLGRWQSARTAERLSAVLVSRSCELYCSDLLRARQTAEIIGHGLERAPFLVPELRDANNGVAANLPRAEALQQRRPMTKPLLDWIPYPEAESWRMMQARSGAFVKGLLDREVDIAVLITHKNVIAGLVQWWLRLDEAAISTTDFEAEPCSLAVLTTADWGGRMIARLNDTAHLL